MNSPFVPHVTCSEFPLSHFHTCCPYQIPPAAHYCVITSPSSNHTLPSLSSTPDGAFPLADIPRVICDFFLQLRLFRCALCPPLSLPSLQSVSYPLSHPIKRPFCAAINNSYLQSLCWQCQQNCPATPPLLIPEPRFSATRRRATPPDWIASLQNAL